MHSTRTSLPGHSGAISRFWSTFATFAGGISLGAFLISFIGGSPMAETLTRAPRFLALAFALCTFPAGVRAASGYSAIVAPRVRTLALLLGSGMATGLLCLTLSSVVAPLTATRVLGESANPAGMTIGELRTRNAKLTASAILGRAPGRVVRDANEVRWEIHHRLAVATLAPILACFGMLASVWLRWPRREFLRALLLWGAGLVTLMVVYASVEQSYDLATQSTVLLSHPGWQEIVGPPLAVTVGMIWPTAVVWWGGSSRAPSNEPERESADA